MMLKDKVVIVTGSTTGIGRSIARASVDSGARVLIHGRNRERGESLARELGEAAVLHIADLLDVESPARIVEAAVHAFGRVDAVVNNAAWVVRSDISDTDVALFDRVMAINVRAPLLLIQAALPYLKEAQGCVANIGSVNGIVGEKNLLAYSMSKAALATLSRNLANSLATDGLRFVHFNVGWVLTENEYQTKLADGLSSNWPTQLDATEIPRGKMTTPEEIASVVTFWLSDAARPFSGTVIELEQYPILGRIPTHTGNDD